MKKFYLLLLLLLCTHLIISCDNNKSLKEELSHLHSAPIKLPSNSTITYLGKDTLIADYFKSKYKMVIYTDSTSCSSCALKILYLWEKLIEWSNKSGNSVKYYFIFNPPKNDNIRLLLRNSLLEYPMLLDSSNEFERLNTHLPKNRALHIFLLDQNYNVVLVGNPIQNLQIEKMFKEIVIK